jgi:hypothetical protein
MSKAPVSDTHELGEPVSVGSSAGSNETLQSLVSLHRARVCALN